MPSIEAEHDLIEEVEELLAKATPGSWRAVAYVGKEPRHVAVGRFTEESPIASPDNPNGLVAYADLPANARLIAAAPELLRRLVEEVKAERLLKVMYGAMRESAEKECAELRNELTGKQQVIDELPVAAKKWEDEAAR